MGSALMVVDIQNDFCPGGSLGVSGADQIIPVVNGLIGRFETVVYTRDWHPEGHISFAAKPRFTDKSWPVHCVAGTWGAAFHPDLLVKADGIIVNKATRIDQEAYSGFQDTDLARTLRERKVDTLFITGLATDYCVRASALDALAEGFKVAVITDAIRGVDVPAGSAQQALRAMAAAGARLITSSEVEQHV
jgi:nicotinamidase/pyrazinamidase